MLPRVYLQASLLNGQQHFKTFGMLICILLFFKYIILFIYFWLRWVFVAARRLSLVVASGLSLVVASGSLWCAGFSLR